MDGGHFKVEVFSLQADGGAKPTGPLWGGAPLALSQQYKSPGGRQKTIRLLASEWRLRPAAGDGHVQSG